MAEGKTDVTDKLPREFYLRDTMEVARDLLGKELVRVTPEGTASGIIVETEAYLGVTDRASHAFGGRLSRRTSIMFEKGGVAYVYLIYGMYWCLNLTTREEGVPECVLVRALEPVVGVDLMTSRRHATGRRSCTLTNGPGKLCRALAIDGTLYGEDLTGPTLFVRDAGVAAPVEVVTTPRIGIDYAGEAALHPWRYCLKGSPCLSRR
ncbi:DNA-3-methyladenine glycosylase [Geobacter sp. DSM 9736]|uniref:DNA-3-methyladenine glycosylase n=1 Tax=Geobacter sp. DSM 9736 TaxID=1277350 RepID=UPI000B5134B7|nr:DNA-3-methyladenine glycosylase [Geobacter sp. DSM 9736]SNB46787.1 DNA-3-methyladenine glycosylase [Geobacter sp. DSM 9736]